MPASALNSGSLNSVQQARQQCFPNETTRNRTRTGPSLSERQQAGPSGRLLCMAAASSSDSKRPRRKAQQPGTFEVKVITPPPRSLGIRALAPDTHNGDAIEVDGQDYVVSAVELRYKLVGGRYQRDHHRLEVQQVGRYILNTYLDGLLQAKPPRRKRP